jgi:hypothetical protein
MNVGYHWLVALLLCFATITAAAPLPGGAQHDHHEALLFSYFGDQAAGLLLAYSRDGLTWTALNQGEPLLAPRVGKDKLMRDPCIAQGPDGVFHLVWTTSWGEKGIGYANSRDLIAWSDQKFLPVMESEPDARNCWAPELFYDDENEQWLIFWASTIPGRFPETAAAGDNGWNHRMYVATTKDFVHISPPEVLYDDGFNCIDATIVRDGDRYVMFIKDETRHPPAKNIRIATSDHAAGPYGPASPPITGDYWAEGPTAMKIGDRWLVYFDKYTENRFGAVASTDLDAWQELAVQFPSGARHGTVFRVSESIMQGLLARQPSGTP